MARHDDAQAFPLSWPDGWPRQQSRLIKHPFKGGPRELTFDRARWLLRDELGRLKAAGVKLSTNVPLRQDGEAYAEAARRRMDDPGVAVYFVLKGRPMVMAQDRYADVAANIRSLALAIDGMRTMERHGGATMMERAFEGFAALPAPDGVMPKRPWWVVLNHSDNEEARADLSVGEVLERYRTLARKRHPDADGGSDAAMSELNVARDEAVRALGGE